MTKFGESSSKFSVPAELVSEYIELLSHETIMAEPKGRPAVAATDRDDVEIVAAAIAAGFQVLATGDAELQRIKRVQRAKLLPPRVFWEELKAQRDDAPDGR